MNPQKEKDKKRNMLLNVYLEIFSSTPVFLGSIVLTAMIGLFSMQKLFVPFGKLVVVYSLSFVGFVVLFKGPDLHAGLQDDNTFIPAARMALLTSFASGLVTPQVARSVSSSTGRKAM